MNNTKPKTKHTKNVNIECVQRNVSTFTWQHCVTQHVPLRMNLYDILFFDSTLISRTTVQESGPYRKFVGATNGKILNASAEKGFANLYPAILLRVAKIWIRAKCNWKNAKMRKSYALYKYIPAQNSLKLFAQWSL